MMMDRSPGGREIEFITGDADAIVRHGSDIASLGRQMVASAALLQRIAEGATGRGYSMDVLRDEVGDLYVDLEQAGDRYTPSGEALLAYGRALGDVQPQLRRVVGECEILWAAYQRARERSAELEVVTSGAPPEGEADDSGDRLADARTAESSAYSDWATEAAQFDPLYDTWDAAYDSALRGLEGANDGGVKDGFWDDALPFIEGAIEILGYVGLVLAVVAIFIGAPLVALAAAIVGVIVLALELAKRFGGGRGTNAELAFAIAGVIPFGRLGAFVGKGRSAFTGMLGDMSGLTGLRQGRAFAEFDQFARTYTVVNSAGNRVQNPNLIRLFRQQAEEIGNLPFRSPTAWIDRIRFGEHGNLHRGITQVLADLPPQQAARLRAALDAGGLGGLSAPIGRAEVVGNIIEAVPTTVEGAHASGSAVRDRIVDSPTDHWSDQLAAAR